MGRAEFGRVAAKQTADAAEPQRLDILADQGARLRAVVHEQDEARAP